MADEENEEQLAPSYDAGDKRSVNTARKKAARKKKQRLEVVAAIMAQPQGRSYMYEYLTRCSTFTTPFVEGMPDKTAFNAGRQSVGHDLQADIMAAAPEMYWVMVKEAQINE